MLTLPRIHSQEAPVVDGQLDDAAWKKAVVANAFWQMGGIETAIDQTTVWLTFDDQALYLAWACQDRKLVLSEVKHDDNQVWKQDCVEVFLSPERDSALERQFIVAASGSTFDRHAGPGHDDGGKAWNPTWQSAVKRQPWGYNVEMRIPLDQLVDVKKHPLRQGDTWSLKLTRHDKGEFTGTRSSTWSPMGTSTADLRGAGKLVFIDANILPAIPATPLEEGKTLQGWEIDSQRVNINLQTLPAETAENSDPGQVRITIEGKKDPQAMARITMGMNRLPVHEVETTYAFTARIKAESPTETLVAYLVAFQGKETQQINFAHNKGWQDIKTLLTVQAGESLKLPILQVGPVAGMSKLTQGGGTIDVRDVQLRIVEAQDIGLDPQSVCLTGNAIDAYRTRNQRIAGTYTYYAPMTMDPWFPHYFLPGTGPEQDYGLYRGQIPFDKGRLTDGHLSTVVDWPAFWESHLGHDIVFDLQEEYQITRVVVKTDWPGQRMTHLYLKSPGESIYTMVASEPDHVAFKMQPWNGDTMPRTDERVFKGIDQPARWVRVQAESRGPGKFSEIEIWGKPLSSPGATPRRVAYRQSGGATPIANPKGTPTPVLDVPPVFPLPQEMTMQGSAIPMRDGLVIHYEPVDSERARITAEVLRDELANCNGLKATIAPAKSGVKADILLGLASDSPVTAQALDRLGQKVTADNPGREGYVLATRDGQIVIAGCDDRGVFYGTQSLLTLMRKDDQGRWELPGTLIRDWPDMPIRIIEGRGVPSRGLVRALARFRVQYYTPKVINIAAAAEHDAFAQRYFVSFVPFLDFNTTVLEVDPTLTERPATERLEDVPQDSRRNANVGHPRTWEIYFAELDKWLPRFHGDILYIGMDETWHYSAGSRWNVSPESRALNMSAGPLLAYTLNKIDAKAKQYGKRVMLHDTPFMRDHKLSYPGDPDPSWRKALPLIPKDVLFNVWHWNKKWVLDPLGKEYGFDLVYLCTGDRDWRPLENMDPNEDYPPTEFPGYFKGINNYMAESSFTASKLLDTMWVAWNADAPRPKGEYANAAVNRYVPLWNYLFLDEALPPTFDSSEGDFTPVDLTGVANRSRIDEVPFDGQGWVDLGPNVDLRALEPGRMTMAGVPFEIIDEKANHGRSVVMIHNPMFTDRTLPSSVEIPVDGLKAASLVFLHCLDNAPGWNYLRRQELAGFYFIVFEDGTYDKLELKYGTSIGTWDGQRYPWEYGPGGDTMSYASVAWTGQTMSGLTAKLYKTQWVNPRPKLAIKKIILRSVYDATAMNPMLLAITAVSPRLAAKADDQPLRSASVLTPPQPVGQAIDLSGGKDESEFRYIAPDGTIIEADDMFNSNSKRTSNGQLANDFYSYVGMITMDGSQFVHTQLMRFIFPQPRRLTGMMVQGRVRSQRKAANFPTSIYNFYVDISNDGGKTWKEVGQVMDNTPDETGPVWIPLPDEPIGMVRLRQDIKDGTPDARGFKRVQFYQQP